jgi:hypothetical protein
MNNKNRWIQVFFFISISCIIALGLLSRLKPVQLGLTYINSDSRIFQAHLSSENQGKGLKGLMSFYDDIKMQKLEKRQFMKNKTEAEYYLKHNMFHPQKVRIIVSPWNLCTHNQGSNLDIFIYLWTRVSTFEHRNVIRSTWASRDAFPSVNVAFVLGLSKNETLNSKVREENEKYGDIIQGDFYDAYRNLSFKSIIQWRWSMYNCRNARFFGKIDDDVFLNTPFLLQTLASKKFTDPSLKLTFAGQILNETKLLMVVRDKTKKYFVSEDFPDNVLKPYVNGPFYVMTSDLPARLYEKAYISWDFWIADAWDGILADKIGGVQFIQMKHLYVYRFNFYKWYDMKSYLLFVGMDFNDKMLFYHVSHLLNRRYSN